MIRTRRKGFCIAALAMILIFSMAVFTGCKSDEPATPDGPDEPESDAVINVGSTEELLDAIESGARIVIAPGYYNMSEYIDTALEQEGEAWNERHPNVRIESCYDGAEITILNVNDMQICGGGQNMADTELVIDAAYGAILNFENCNNVVLSSMTMGHTVLADCAGNVVNFFACSDIELDSVDLYGCGVFGIAAYDGTSNMHVNNSVIRDCSYGPFSIIEGKGTYEFRDCSMTGSYGGGNFEKSRENKLEFYNCSFGQEESNTWLFRDEIYTEDCAWTEPSIYPDYGYDE